MSKLRIGADGFGLKAEAFEDVVAILGRRGRGKTTTATVIVEGLHAAGARFVVADPVGVWFGLKSSRDGRRPGIPVVVMGGDHGDVPLAPESGEIIADFVADPMSPSVVLDLKAFTQGEMVRFMTAFLARLYHVNPGKPLHVVLDEADQFAPQRPMPGEQAMLGAAQRVTKLGRAKGLHPMLITQRPATLSKNVLTQAGLLIAHAITGPQDRNAVDDWIKANADEGERDKFLAELSGLPRGTAYFWSPDIPLFRQVAVRDRETFDSSATPKRGEATKPKALAEVDLEALKGRIAATIEKAKAEDPRELRKTIAQLRKELNEQRNVKDSWKQSAANAMFAKQKRVDVPILKDAQIKRLEAAVDRMRECEAAFFKTLGQCSDKLAQRQQVVVNEAGLLREAITTKTRERGATVPAEPARPALPAVPGGGRGPSATPSPVRPSPPPGNGSAAVGQSGLRRILVALAQRPQGLSVRQVGVRAGISSKSGTFDTYLSRARSSGWITGGRDRIQITEQGLEALGHYEPLPAGPDLLRHWLAALGGSGAARMLRALADAYPRALSREELGTAANLTGTSGTFDTYVSRLRSLELIEGRGELRATAEFFEELA